MNKKIESIEWTKEEEEEEILKEIEENRNRRK